MKSQLYNRFIKFITYLLILGYLYSFYHVVYVDNITKKENIINNIGNAFVFLLWIILLLFSGVPLKDIIK